MDALDKTVAMAPENPKLRLLRGSIGVNMPSFLGKLNQSMENLDMVLENDVGKSKKAEALYYLGIAHQKKTMEYWNKVVMDYPSTEAYKTVLGGMRPKIKRIDRSEFKNPVVVVNWGMDSKFVDTDAVTSVSIDVGHHIHLWALKNYTGKIVNAGEFFIKIEVSSWLSMKYQLVSAPIKIGSRGKRCNTISDGCLLSGKIKVKKSETPNCIYN